MLNADYFKRIDAMNFTLLHDDGQLPDDLEEADVLLLGVSRTSKTPTSIYLANRGVKTANVPLIPGVPLPPRAGDGEAAARGRPRGEPGAHRADPAEPAAQPQGRRRHVLCRSGGRRGGDRLSRGGLCARHDWPIIDVTRRSIEETAAAILDLYRDHRLKFIAV